LKRLLQELQLGTSFYQMLILSIKEFCSEENDGAIHQAVNTILYKSLIFLGDIARYRTQYSAEVKTWLESWVWYEKAYTLQPVGSKPLAQLALLAIYKQSDYEVLYYYCLGIGNLDSNAVTRTNLLGFLAKYTDYPIPRSNANFQYLCECAVILFSALFRPDLYQDSWVDYCVALADNVSFMVFQDFHLLAKLNTIFVILVHDLSLRFETSDGATSKQQIRNCQTLALSFLFMICKRCTDIVLEQLLISDRSIVLVEYVVPISDIVTCLGIHTKWFGVYLEYGNRMHADFFEKTFFGFLRSIVTFANRISSFADMDGSNEYTISDHYLIGLKAYSPVFDTLLSSESRIPCMDPIMAHYSRVAYSIKCISDSSVLCFTYIEYSFSNFSKEFE
jgi:hypothetical protein